MQLQFFMRLQGLLAGRIHQQRRRTDSCSYSDSTKTARWNVSSTFGPNPTTAATHPNNSRAAER